MNINHITLLALAFSSGLALAADAAHDDHGSGHAAPAKAGTAKAAPAKAEPAKADTHGADAGKPEAAAHDAPAAEPKPVKKAKRKPKTKTRDAKPAAKNTEAPEVDAHGPAHGMPATADAPHDAHNGHKAPDAHAAQDAPAAPAPSARRTRVKDRAAASAAAAPQADAHGNDAADTHAAPADGHSNAHSNAHNLAHGDAHAAMPAAASAAPANVDAAPHAADHAAPVDAIPAAPAPRVSRVSPKKSVAARSAPSAAATADAGHASPADGDAQAAADAHGDAHGHADAAARGADGAHGMQDMHGAAQHAPVAPAAGVTDAASAAPKTAASNECDPPLKGEVAALFDRWNASLRTGDPRKVVANYAPNSVLLPTVSNRARYTVAEKEDYFMHFLQRRPEGRIDDRVIDVDCNSATDAGLYTFRFADGTSVKARYSFSYKKIDGQWLITSHHSSAMPEKAETAAADGHAQPAPAAAAQARSANDSGPGKGWVRFP